MSGLADSNSEAMSLVFESQYFQIRFVGPESRISSQGFYTTVSKLI